MSTSLQSDHRTRREISRSTISGGGRGIKLGHLTTLALEEKQQEEKRIHYPFRIFLLSNFLLLTRRM